MTRRRRRAERIEDAELVGEVIASPGVRPHARPTPVHLAEVVEVVEPPPISPLAAVVAYLPPDLAARVTQAIPVAQGLLATIQQARALLEELQAPRPRRRRLR